MTVFQEPKCEIFILCDRCFYQISLRWTLTGKKDKIVLNAFIQIVNESNRKPNKLWVDQGIEFYNKRNQ